MEVAMVVPLACELMLAGSIASAGAMIGYSLGKRKRDSGYEEETVALRRRVGDLEALVHERVDDLDRRVGGVEASFEEQAAVMQRIADGMEAMSQEQAAATQRLRDDLEAKIHEQEEQRERMGTEAARGVANLKTELTAEIHNQAVAMQTVVDDSKEELTKQTQTRADGVQAHVLGQADATERLMQHVQALRGELCEVRRVPAADVAEPQGCIKNFLRGPLSVL